MSDMLREHLGEQQTYSTREAAEIVSVHVGAPITDATIRWWISELELPISKAGTRWRLTSAEVRLLTRVAEAAKGGVPLAEVRQRLAAAAAGDLVTDVAAATGTLVPGAETESHPPALLWPGEAVAQLRELIQQLPAKMRDAVVEGLRNELDGLSAQTEALQEEVQRLGAALERREEQRDQWLVAEMRAMLSERREGFWARLLRRTGR